MIIKVNGCSTLSSINQDFNKQYPFLSLRFYRRNSGANSNKKNVVDLLLSIVEAGSIIRDDEVECHFWQTTGWVEKQFSRKTGFDVQILRKFKDKWIITDGSDMLTLEEQNEMGMKDSMIDVAFNGLRNQKSI